MSTMHAIRLAVLLLVACSAFASPVITSVTPSQGSVFGGTEVVITGSGFSDNCIICSPPFGGLSVHFGETQATNILSIEHNEVRVLSPSHQPGTVDVRINQIDGSDPNFDVAENAFTYTGQSLAAFEPVLFPIFMPPVPGAFGSQFVTTARVASRLTPFDLFGVDESCRTSSPIVLPEQPFRIGVGEVLLGTSCSNTVGRLFYVARPLADNLVANLRVTDFSRQADSHGVEIPVVREDDFTTGRLVLLGVPIDPRYRQTLRIYGLHGGAQNVNVTINGIVHNLNLEGDDSNMFAPVFATFTNFPTLAELPAGQTTVSVVIQDSLEGRGIVPPTPIWAFVSVTNNQTQQITVVTPN